MSNNANRPESPTTQSKKSKQPNPVPARQGIELRNPVSLGMALPVPVAVLVNNLHSEAAMEEGGCVRNIDDRVNHCLGIRGLDDILWGTVGLAACVVLLCFLAFGLFGAYKLIVFLTQFVQ